MLRCRKFYNIGPWRNTNSVTLLAFLHPLSYSKRTRTFQNCEISSWAETRSAKFRRKSRTSGGWGSSTSAEIYSGDFRQKSAALSIWGRSPSATTDLKCCQVSPTFSRAPLHTWPRVSIYRKQIIQCVKIRKNRQRWLFPTIKDKYNLIGD